MKSPPPHRPLPPPVLVMATATLTLLAALAAQRTLAQAVNPGAGAVYFPKSRRALLFGGATRPTYFRTITALDLSKPFATNAAPFSTLPSAQLPTGTQYLIPWVSTSGSDVALFGGIVSNATSSTSVNVNGVIPASAIYEAKVTNDGAGVDSISSRQFVYNVQAPCYTLATIAGGVDDGKTYLFGGFSYFTNLETDELRVFDDSKSLKNVTIAGSTRPPRRQLGSLARIDARRLILSGGYLNNLPMADAWIFDLQANTWSPAGNLTSARYNHQTVVVKPSGSSKTYIVQVGGDSARSVFEYAELPASGSVGFNWKRSLSVEGKADLTYMVNQAPVVIGDQIVMFGVSLDPQSFDKFASVVAFKVKESSPGSLAFEWVENYVPAAGEESKPAIGPGSSGSGGDTGSGGTSGGGTSMTLVGILVGMAIIGVGVAGFLWFKRSKKKTAAQHKPLSNNANNNSTAPPPSGPPSVVSPQQPATVFAPAPNVHQQFPQQQPQPQVMQQQQQPAQLYQPQYQQQQQQQPMVDNRMSYMSTSMPQPQPQQPYDPRMSYMSTAQSAITTYPQSPPPTSHLSGPKPYPAAQMPIAYLPPHPPQPPTHAFPVSGIAPPMGPPAKTDDGGQDKAAWFAGQQQQEHTQQVYMMPQVQQVQTVPSAPQAPAQAMVVTPMPIPQQQQQAVQKVQGEEEEVLYLGGQAAPAPAPASGQTQPPGRPY